MRMLQSNPPSLANALGNQGDLSGRFVFDVDASIALHDLMAGSVLNGQVDDLYGRSVLIATESQLAAAAAMLELDGVARRITLCPPDLQARHLPGVIETAGADAIVSDQPNMAVEAAGIKSFIHCDGQIVPRNHERRAEQPTEWVLLTSGTTGAPKLVVHTLSTLAGAFKGSRPAKGHVVWTTFYDIRRYGGLQIFLRAALTGTSLVLSSSRETTGAFLARAAFLGVTHISGTPSHWRRALMSPSAALIAPEYVRLSGEIADQAILDHLRLFYPQALVAHAFASTEAGVAFDVNDGMTGFNEGILRRTPGVEMKIENDTLRVRSSRTASCYLGDGIRPIKDGDGFVDTSDVVELREGRYHFVGRRDGVINVGGLKIHPEEVEEVINRHPDVRMSLVRMKKNTLTGALVVADVVLRTADNFPSRDDRHIKQEILLLCRDVLSPHKVPAVITFVSSLAVAETGKLIRSHA
jgi:acyl-coenzyme A synthetase/AMP-(fatty) acid ligase